METATIQSIQLLGVIFSLFLIISVFFMVKARYIREKYSLVWFLIGLFTLVMSMFTGLMEAFSRLIGVDYAPSAFFAILITCAYLLLLHMSVSLSGMKMHNKTLTQELGLLKLKIEQLEKKMKEGERSS